LYTKFKDTIGDYHNRQNKHVAVRPSMLDTVKPDNNNKDR